MDDLDAALELGPANEEQLARLRRALSLGTGFQLVLVEVAQPGLAREVLRRLRRWSGKDGVPELTVVRTRPGRDPVAPLRRISGGAVLIGIDQPFDLGNSERELVTDDDSGPSMHAPPPAGEPVEHTMTTLNWYRDELPSLVEGPLVLMLSPDGLRQLFVHAPDLLAWRAHTTRLGPPRLIHFQIHPRPSRRASREEKAWLEQMIASAAQDGGGPLTRELPGWLIRLGEIEAREGGPWAQRLARAQELAAGRHDILFRVELARAHCDLHRRRYKEAWDHASSAARHLLDNRDEAELGSEPMLETLGWGSASRDVWSTIAANRISIVGAELFLRAGHTEQAASMAESALLGARAHGDSALVLSALAVAGAIATHRGDRLVTLARLSEMRRLARDAGDRAAESFALTRLAELASDVESKRRLYLEALSLLDEDDHESRARACIGLIRSELRGGRTGEAEPVLSLIPLAELEPETRIDVLIIRGALATARDRPDEALAAYRAAWDEPQRVRRPVQRQANLGTLLGEVALRVGDAATAREAFQRAAEIAEVLADDELAATARAGLARASATTGEPPRATQDEGDPGGHAP